MRDAPRKAWTKIAPQCLTIVALSALLVSGIDRDATPKTSRASFPDVARQLRVGMRMDEASAMIFAAGGRRPSIAGSLYSSWYHFVDARGEYELAVWTQTKGHILDFQYNNRVVKWDLRRR